MMTRGATLHARPGGLRCYVASLAKEACVLVLLHYSQKFFDGRNLGYWFVAMPFEVGAHPKHLPYLLGSDEGGLGEGAFAFYLGPVPLWTNLEQLDALTRDTEPEIELGADGWGRPLLLDERIHCLLDSLALNVVQRHVLAT